MIWKTLFVAFVATEVVTLSGGATLETAKLLTEICRPKAVLAQDLEITDQRREQLRQMLEAQCRRLGAEDKVKDVESSINSFGDCLKDLINPQALKDEIEAAKPKGELDEVFKKYCTKAPQLKSCLSSLLEGIKPCVDKSAHEYYSPVLESANKLIDFVCHKDGERIALFIAYSGRECFKNSTDDIKKCGEKMRESFPNIETAKSMSVPDKCAKFDELAACVVTALEKCDNPTPANMTESLIKFIRQGSACNEALPKD